MGDAGRSQEFFEKLLCKIGDVQGRAGGWTRTERAQEGEREKGREAAE